MSRGDRFRWGELTVEVRRLARDGTWADIRVSDGRRAVWTKRQRLPLASGITWVPL